jgi:hypothetical protein
MRLFLQRKSGGEVRWLKKFGPCRPQESPNESSGFLFIYTYMKIALSFSYNGFHKKSTAIPNQFVVIDPIKHLQMLIAAIDCANPHDKYDVIVSAIGFNYGNMSKSERMLALEVHKRATIVVTRRNSQSHQIGAAIAIQMALEAATALNAEYLIHMAEDVIMCDPDFVEYFKKHLSDCDYVGSNWFTRDPEKTLNTQVFGCRVSSFEDVFPCSIIEIEHQLYQSVISKGLRYKIGEELYSFPECKFIPHVESENKMYYHTHDPDEFMQIIENRNI